MSGRNVFNLESLENRRMLAGVTVLIHGHEGSIDGWVSSAATAIAERIGTSQTSQFILKVGKVSGDLTVQSFTLQRGPLMVDSTTGEAIVKVDWTSVDDGSYSTKEVGNVVADYLMTTHGTAPPLAELPLHLIGHSRGASMAVAISQRLGRAGVWVDQTTFLDPRPVESLFGLPFGYDDAPMKVYNNVIFADNYWREDGNLFDLDPDGMEVDNTHEVDLNNIVQKKFVVSAHMSVTSYYHGTIDQDATTNRDGAIFSTWYGNSSVKPARNATGYVFSRLGGSARPADGLISGFGGTADRSGAGQAGAQWSNGGNLRLVGGTSFTVGDKLKLRFIHQDRDGPTNVTIVMDADSNPYNANAIRTMRRADIAQAQNMTLTSLSAFTGGVEPGKYFLYARLTDAQGHTRYTYSRRITLNAPVVSAVSETRAEVRATPFSTTAPAITSLVLSPGTFTKSFSEFL